MNTEKRPVLCTILYRKPMQPCNFDSILYQLRQWIFSHGFHQKIRFKRNFRKRPKRVFRQKSNFQPYSDALRQDPPLEAILVIFGRRALIFFLLERSSKKMKNDTTFVRMRSGDHLGDAKMSKKGTSLRRI